MRVRRERQELGAAYFAVSEAITATAFCTFALWVISPFALGTTRFHVVSALTRFLVVVSACQLCRVAAFSATQLPSPAPHCAEGAAGATLPLPRSVADVLVVDVAKQVNRGCGDLIFSSHVTFVMAMALTYGRYGSRRVMKAANWGVVALNCVIIVASRKHYTVDVVVALFTVPLVWEAVATRLHDPPRQTLQQQQQLLPR